MDIALVNDVDVENLTAERRKQISEMLRRVLIGQGLRLTRMQERVETGGRFTLLLEFEPDPNPLNVVVYRPLRDG